MTELQLLQRRIDAVYKALQYPYLSEWAIQYWNTVLNQLVKKLPKNKLH